MEKLPFLIWTGYSTLYRTCTSSSPDSLTPMSGQRTLTYGEVSLSG